MKDNNDIQASILNAIIANTTTKVVFAMRAPADAEALARALFVGFIDYVEYKEGTERPLVVGHHKEIVRNRSTAHHAAEHEATSETESIARGIAHSHMRSVTEAEGESITDATSEASALGSMSSEAFGSATSSFDGISNSASMDPTTGGVFMPPTVTSLGTGASSGAGMTDMASHSLGSSATEISGSSHARSTSHMTAVTEAFGTTESEVRGFATSRMKGISKGVSESAGEAETFVPTIAWLSSEIMNLGHREVFVKVDNQRPVRTRTSDLAPAFRSDYCRRMFMPVFERSLVARSPYLLAVSEVDAQIAARQPQLTPPLPEPDFTAPEPLPIVNDPQKFAQQFVAKHTPLTDEPPKPKPTKPRPGRRPVGGESLDPRHDDLRVIDGDKKD